MQSERSEVKLDAERAEKRLAHWRSVVVSACEQSGRARVPEIAVAATVVGRRVVAGIAASLPARSRGRRHDRHACSAIDGACVLAVGPEGGWSERDRATLHAAGFTGLRLGPRILRTETAGLAAIAALQARFGDLG